MNLVILQRQDEWSMTYATAGAMQATLPLSRQLLAGDRNLTL